MKELLILLIRLYQVFFSPLKSFFGGTADCCRYTPSCSVYAIDALKNHGAAAGSVLAVRRVWRCHPWGASGYDPVRVKKKVMDCHG